MARHFSHAVFALIYFALSFGASVLLSGPVAGTTEALLGQIVPIATAPLALLAALRLGALSKAGVAAASLIVELASYCTIWGIYYSLAVPTEGSVSFWAPAQQGGWLLALSTVLFVLSPVVWLHFLGSQRRRGHAPNVAA